MATIKYSHYVGYMNDYAGDEHGGYLIEKTHSCHRSGRFYRIPPQ